MKLVIVESPTKAKTLNRFLGNDYQVMASAGHVRDIPSNKMNIDVEHDFEPVYEISEGKKALIADLTKQAKKADFIYLATDPDREGEAIAYHVRYLLEQNLKTKKEFKRISFHQITKAAVEEAIAHAGNLDLKLVDAQQARRILDRLVGYSLSPVLWRKVRRGLSAGRVQSVALRLIVDREKEIAAFVKQEYWDIAVNVSKQAGKASSDRFWTQLVKVEKTLVEKKTDDNREFLINSEEKAKPIILDLKQAVYTIADINKREKHLHPKPPHTTSTMQQAAANSLGWTSKHTMSVAQGLYEEGLITYHRTDSMNLAPEAIQMVRSYIDKEFGADYVPKTANFFKTKNKSAQEAHEAIRPTDVSVVPTSDKVSPMAAKLYGLIWKRFVASQMVDAVIDATTVVVNAKGDKHYELKTTGSIMKFPGWKKLFPKSKEEDQLLPDLVVDEKVDYKDMTSEQKFTLPPPRYNDASLIKTLEELGIGRPSTYAPTIGTLIGRAYMERVERRFVPTAVGITVTDFLAKEFKEIMDYGFTAEMENDLDKIAEGKKEWVPMMKSFWGPFNKLVKEVTNESKRVQVPTEKTGRKCPKCGEAEGGDEVIRVGRFGKFLSCSRFPDCDYTDRYQIKVADIKCPKCDQGDVVVKKTRKGRNFFGCSRYPNCDWASWTDPRLDKEKAEKTEKSNETKQTEEK